MSKDELLDKLARLKDTDDTESAHAEADSLLLEYINDSDITTAYSAIYKWYA